MNSAAIMPNQQGSSHILVGGYRIAAFSCVAELVKSFDFPSFRKS